MDSMPLIIRIIVSNNDNALESQAYLVNLDESEKIKEFRAILKHGSRERALNFALSQGKIIESKEADFPVKLTLTKEHAVWDLISRKSCDHGTR